MRLISLFLLSAAGSASVQALPIDKLTLPQGFTIEVYADNVPDARQMALGHNGVVYVGSRGEGSVHAVVDKDGDYRADEVVLVASDLNMPSGLTYKDGDLFVSEVSKVRRFANIDNNYRNKPASEVVIDGLPTDKHHGWKYIDFGPDGWLYVPVGAPCNICQTNGGEEFDNPDYATILRFDLNTKEKQIVARGVRNSVGFDWHPETKNLWFSDNGRDWMGDDIPPCELNHVTERGQHFGYPYFHGGTIADPEFGKGKNPDEYVHPEHNLMAHVAPLGIHFYEGKMFPQKYNNRLFVAEHGSWNRSKKSGYRVMMATIANGDVVSYEPFIEGWLNKAENTAWGRPVAVMGLPDGSILVSDDFANTIYRVTYRK